MYTTLIIQYIKCKELNKLPNDAYRRMGVYTVHHISGAQKRGRWKKSKKKKVGKNKKRGREREEE